MKNKKDIFNGKIIDSEIGRIKFTLIYIPALSLVLGIVGLIICITYENVEPDARILGYVISISSLIFSFIYAFATIPLIRCYPKYRKLTHIFVREEFFKANYSEEQLEAMSIISNAIRKKK